MSLFLLGLNIPISTEFIEAESFYEKALSIFEKVFSKNDTVVLNVLQNLAFVYQSQGKYPEAETTIQKSI